MKSMRAFANCITGEFLRCTFTSTVIILAAAFLNTVNAQSPGTVSNSGVSPGNNSNPSLNVTIDGPIPIDQPVGKRVELRAITTATQPTYTWSATCTATRTGGFPDSALIYDRIGPAGTQVYDVLVRDNAGVQGSARCNVDFMPPNHYRLRATGTQITTVGGKDYFVTPKLVTFRYKNSNNNIENIGEGADACVQELWQFVPNNKIKWMKGLNFQRVHLGLNQANTLGE